MDEAEEAYLKAAAFAEKHLGPHNGLTKSMKDTAKSVQAARLKERQKRLARQAKSSYRIGRPKSSASFNP